MPPIADTGMNNLSTASRGVGRRAWWSRGACVGAEVLLELCRIRRNHTHQPTQASYAKRAIRGATWMEKKWRVGDLQSVQEAHLRAMSQIGFVLYDETGQPCHVWVFEPR